MQLATSFFSIYYYFMVFTRMRILTSEIDELVKLATKNEVNSKCVSNNINHLYINKKQYEIYAYNGDCDEHEELKFRSNTLSLLYTCINCEMAEVIRDQFFKIIEPMPVLYHLSFLKTPLDHVYFMTYVKGLDPFLQNIIIVTEEFINILLYFQNMYLDANDTSADTQLSTTLLRFNFAINALKNKFENDKNTIPTDVDVIRIVLEALNSIQNFTYLNCKINLHYDNKQFYGFSMKKEDEPAKRIEDFYNDIQSLNLKKHKSCNVNQMLLLKVITKMTDKFAWKIQGYAIKVSPIIEIIKLTEDLSKLFWYQKYVFGTLMILLLKKIEVHYSSQSSQSISEDIWNKIRDLISLLKLLEIVNLQPNLHTFLSLFKSNNENTIPHTFLDEINGYTTSSPIDIIDNDSTIRDFLDYINTFKDDVICFMRIFKHLSYKFNDIIYDDQTESFTDKIKTFEQEIITPSHVKSTEYVTEIILEEENNSSLANVVPPNLYDYNTKGCKLFTNLYHYFYKCIIDLNRASSEDKETYKKENKYNYYPEIKKNIETVFRKIKELVPRYHLPHLKTVLNIIPLIELREESLFTEYYHNELTRTIYVLMTELNTYGIEYCTPPNYNFLLFNNMNFDVIPQFKNINHLIDDPVNSLKNTNLIPLLKNNWYENLLKPITQIIENLKKFQVHDTIIEQNWKGEKITLGYLYKFLKNTTLSSSNALTVLEFSLKFFLAVLFYEIDINNIIKENLNEETFVEDILDHFASCDFPKKYHSIKKDILNYISYYKGENENNDMKNNVLIRFNNVGVFIKYPESTIPLNDTITSSSRTREKIQEDIKYIIHLLVDLNLAIYNLEFFDDI